MAESNFVDYVKIYCRSGKGGRGSSHFRREKYIPKGGRFPSSHISDNRHLRKKGIVCAVSTDALERKK